jgi:branched-subunit amino acid transport protein AzlD
MIDSTYALGAIFAMALVTLLLRAMPFISARFLLRFPVVGALGRFLPPAIMTLLLLHTLYGSAEQNPNGPLPELIAAAATIIIQWWSRHALASILTGTALYVIFRNYAFFV